MLKQERKSQQHKVLYRCQHHLYPEKYSYEVLLQDNNVGIVCQSKGDKKTWRQRISLCLVSALIQRYYFSMNTLWDLLAHSITFIGSEMKFSTQHIVNYHTRKTSKHVDAYIIWQKSKEISPEETWFVEFLSECTGAFTLEMCIRKAFGDIHRYACRVEQSHIAHLFETHCLEPYSDPVRNNLPKEAIEDYPMETNHLLQALLDDLFFDEETDSFMVKFVELSSLENYLDGSEQRTHQKAAPQKTLSALRTDPFRSESNSDEDNESSYPASPAQSPSRIMKQTPHMEVKSKDNFTHYEIAQARRLARNNGTVYDPTAHLASQKERLVHHAAVAEVPELIGQISLKTEFHRRPPAMDRLRTDTELDDLAVSIISEMDLRRDPTDAQSQPQPQSAPSIVEAPLYIDVDASYASSPLGTARTVHSVEFFVDELQDEEDHQLMLRLDTEDIDVDDELEHSAAFSALLRKATSGPPGARLNPTFTPTQSAKDPLARKLAELREKYARATHESTVSHTLSDEGSDNGDTNDYDGSYLEEETDMFRSQYGFEESVKQEEISEILVEVSAPVSVSTAQSDKSAMRKDFLKNFKKSKFYRPPADNGAAAKAKLKEVTDSNQELVLRMMAAAVQKLVDPAKALRTASRRGPVTVSFPLVQDALAMHASYRSFVSSSLIIDMFKEGCKLSPFLTHCSEDDLLALCQACTLQDLLPKEKEKNNTIEALHLRGEAVLSVYIVMRGQLEVTSYETEDVGFDGPMEEIVETHRLVAGDCIGECALEGIDSWEVDVAAVHTQPISLCCISLEAAQCYIGRRTEESERIICLFWKFHRLWQEIKLHNQEMLLHAKYQKDLAGGPKKRENLHFDFSPMNVINSCRIRVYQPGADVFTHHRPRHFLYLVLRGCCEYRRTFPENIVAAGLMPPYKEIGKPLMCGDFSFMDGEDHLWLDRMDDQDELVAGSLKDSAHIREHKLRKYCRFDRHKNSLVATTRVEIAVVPLREIAKCLKLFVKLIRLATEKYPDTFIASEELVRQHYEGEKWKVDRKDVIRSIAADKEARVLRESYYHSVLNNESDALYKANQPGAKMQQSTLHSIIQHFALDRTTGGPTDIPPEQLAKQHAARKESWSASQKVDTSTSTKSNSNNGHNANFQTDRKDSAYANQSNKILDDMNRPRREALDDYFKQFGTSRSRKNSRKWSVSECDTTESGSASQSRRNSTKSTRSNSFVGSPPAGGEKSFKARPPLWISRPSSAGGGSARHSVSGSNTPTGEMNSPTSRGTFSPRPSQKSASPPKSITTTSVSVSTTPAVSSRQSNAGRRPSSACGATASSMARMTVPERPFSSQSARTRQISPPPRSEYPPAKLAPTPPKTTSPGRNPGKTRPGAAARPRSAVPLSVASVVPTVNHNEYTERPHSTGSSRHFNHSAREINESNAPITTLTTTTSDGDGASVRIKKKNVGFANFASEFAVDDALAAELNGFAAVDSNTAGGMSHKTSSDLQCSPEVVMATSPLRTVPFQSAPPLSSALSSPAQVSTSAQHQSPSTGGSPHTHSLRYWRIKDETRKQSNRPVPIDPEKFVEAYREFTADDPRNKFVQEFVTRTLI